MSQIVWQPDSKLYQLKNVIGSGTQAIVFDAYYTGPDKVKQQCAIKAINLDKAAQNIDQLSHETQMLLSCKHPNICQLNQSFVHSQYLWLVMPRLQVSLLDVLMKASPIGFDEVIISTMMFDILNAIHYLHQNNHVHRDIKLSNFLLDSRGNAQLSDFGVASVIRPFSNQIKCQTFVGSPLYMAPEVASNRGDYSLKCDIWSFGMCLYQLSHGNLPYQNMNPMEALMNVVQKDPPKLKSNRQFSKNFKDLVELCLVKDPAKRADTKTLLECQFWKKQAKKEQIVSLLQQTLQISNQQQQNHEDQVKSANDILHSDEKAMESVEFWDFEDEPVITQAQVEQLHTAALNSPNDAKEKESPEKRVHSPDNADEYYTYSDKDYSYMVTDMKVVIEEVMMLRQENTKLREENRKIKDRLKLMTQNQDDD